MFKKIFIGLVVLVIAVIGTFYYLGSKEHQDFSRPDSTGTIQKPVLLTDPVGTFDFDLSPDLRKQLRSGPGIIVMDIQFHPPNRLMRQRFVDLGMYVQEVTSLPARVTVRFKELLARIDRKNVTNQIKAQIKFIYMPGGKAGVPFTEQNLPYAYHQAELLMDRIVESAVPVQFREWDAGKRLPASGEFLEGNIDLKSIRQESGWSNGVAYLAAERVEFEERSIPPKEDSKKKGRRFSRPMEAHGYIPVAWVKVDLSKDNQPFSIPRDVTFTPSFTGPLRFRLARCPEDETHDPFLCVISAVDESGKKDGYGIVSLTTPDRRMPTAGERGAVLIKDAQ